MKTRSKLILLVVLVLFLMGCQVGHLFGPAPTPTPTIEQIYCQNYVKNNQMKDDFIEASTELTIFLADPVENNKEMTNGYMLGLTVLSGPMGIDALQQTSPKLLQDTIYYFSQFTSSAMKYNLEFNRSEAPTALSYSHGKVIACLENALETGTAYSSFFKDRQPIGAILSFPACNDISIYFSDIDSFCQQH